MSALRKYSKLKDQDFAKIYKASCWHCEGFVIFYRPAKQGQGQGQQQGFAVVAGKKVGKAVARNRAKRRMRAAFAELARGESTRGELSRGGLRQEGSSRGAETEKSRLGDLAAGGLAPGSYVLLAKAGIEGLSFATLAKNLSWGLGRLGCLKRPVNRNF